MLRSAVRKTISATIGAMTSAAVNGPGFIRATAAFAFGCIDDRRRVSTPHGAFTLRTANPVERWRADTLLDKEPETIAWLDETIEDGSVFFDVGANVGVYTLYACHLGRAGVRAVCFEPEALNFARLNTNLHDNGLSDRAIAFPVALGSEPGPAAFELSAFDAGAALHGDRNVRSGAAAHRQGIFVHRLDDLLAQSDLLPRPTHLKIDVDGPELDVLTGARETLGNPDLRHVLVELGEQATAPAIEFMTQMGFEITATGPREGGWANHIFERKAAA